MGRDTTESGVIRKRVSMGREGERRVYEQFEEIGSIGGGGKDTRNTVSDRRRESINTHYLD